MKAMWAGFAATIIIGIAANFVLAEIGFSAEERYSGASVRLN